MIVSGWQSAKVARVTTATAHSRVLELDVAGWRGSAPGQHVDVRLTAEDGYQAVRSYSLSSFGPGERIELAVDEVPEGEVSPYLVRDVQPGDELEVKGPLGGYFVWHDTDERPVQLIAGGSGVVPLVGIARARFAPDTSSDAPFRLLYSARSREDALYADEVERLAGRGLELTWAYTRHAPEGWTGRVGRLDDATIGERTWEPRLAPLVYVCGPTAFVEHVADALVRAGHQPANVKTERFGGA